MGTQGLMPPFKYLFRSHQVWRPSCALIFMFFLCTHISLNEADAQPPRKEVAQRTTEGRLRSQSRPAGSEQEDKNSEEVTSQALALGTVSMAQSRAGYRLFGDSGLTLSFSSVVSQKLYESPDPQFDQGFSYSFGLGLQLTRNYFSSLSFSIDHQPSALEERDQVLLRNAALSFYRNPYSLKHGFTLTPNLSFRLPVGRQVVANESLRLGVAPSATLGLPPLWSGSKLGVSYSLAGTYNNHEFTHAASGNPNVRWGLNHGLTAAYPLIQGVTLSVGANHGLAWTTLGTTREYVGHSEAINWRMSPNASLSLGHTNQGAMYALDGVVYDFSFLSERNSIVYGRLSLTI